MIDEGVVSVLVTASVLGGVGWAWRTATRRAVQRHELREAAAREAGWAYEPFEHGFLVAGRTLTCEWSLRTDAMGAARATVFSLGAPDERRAMLALGTGEPPGALPHQRRWPADGTRLSERLWLEACEADDVQRVLDAETARLLSEWLADGRAREPRRLLRAWLSPHGVEIACPESLRDWSEVERLVRLGVALGRRAGLA